VEFVELFVVVNVMEDIVGVAWKVEFDGLIVAVSVMLKNGAV
jgi:hypothetical protein